MPPRINHSLIDEYEKLLSVITPSDSQKFWLIRTLSGEYYDSFKENNYVSLDHSDFTLRELSTLRSNYSLKNDKQLRLEPLKEELKRLLHLKNEKELKKIIIKSGEKSKEHTDFIRELGLRTSQIFNFTYELNKGDYVVIPSENSTFVSIGRITKSELIDTEDAKNMRLQKSVKWIKEINKHEIDPNFFKIFWSHQAINNIGDYRDVVLRSTHDFYVDKDNAHLVINVQVAGVVNALDYYGFGYNFLTILQDYFNTYGLPYDASKINTMSNINSKGIKKLFGKEGVALLIGGMILISLTGGSGSFKLPGGIEADLHLNGIIPTLNEFLNDQTRRQALDKTMHELDSMKVKSPDINDMFRDLGK